jgi:hypothetical protein
MIKNLDEYNKFIESCKKKVYSEPIHKHHIVPKFMGGSDEKENLIELSVSDHFKAHEILARTVSKEFKSKAWWSVATLKDGWSGDVKSIIENLRLNSLGDKNPFYGRRHSDETKRKMSENHSYWFRGKTYEEIYGNGADEMKQKISKSKDKFKKPVLQLDMNGNLIREWESQKQAKRETGIGHIGDVCNGTRNKAGGYKWKLKNE